MNATTIQGRQVFKEGNYSRKYGIWFIIFLVSLDYPDMDPVGTDGSITYGDFGPAREEVQKASGLDCKNYNIEISVFNGLLITKGIISEDGKMIYSWGKF